MKIKIGAMLKAAIKQILNPAKKDGKKGLTLPVLPPGVGDGAAMAQDSAASDVQYMSAAEQYVPFLGYPALAAMATQSEFRQLSEKLADAAVYKWITLTSTSEANSDKIAKINEGLQAFGIRELFREAATLDGEYGRAQIYVRTAASEADPNEDATPLTLDTVKIPVGSVRGFSIVEPSVTCAKDYNSTNPLAPDYYKPSAWFVMANTVHSTRLMLFVSRPVSNFYKPSYNFGGVSLSQLALECITDYRKMNNSIQKITRNFSLSGIKTDMQAASLAVEGEEMTTAEYEAGDGVLERAELYAGLREKLDLLMLDKDEEFFQFNIPLSGLDKLLAMALERRAEVGNIPLVVLLGISPTGLNASNDGDLKVWHETIGTYQDKVFRHPLETIVNILQLHYFGVIDPTIKVQFNPLEVTSRKDNQEIQTAKANANKIYIESGVFQPDEVRNVLIRDPDSGYDGVSMAAHIELPEETSEPDAVDV